jgi:hypothetical protein
MATFLHARPFALVGSFFSPACSLPGRCVVGLAANGTPRPGCPQAIGPPARFTPIIEPSAVYGQSGKTMSPGPTNAAYKSSSNVR